MEKATGITLTEVCAMYPASSVSGWYFGHPDSKYFAVGKLERDQVARLRRAQGDAIARRSERWLAPYLNYEPVKAGI